MFALFLGFFCSQDAVLLFQVRFVCVPDPDDFGVCPLVSVVLAGLLASLVSVRWSAYRLGFFGLVIVYCLHHFSAADCLGQRNKMPAYQYPNLTIIEEGQLQRDERDVFQAAVIFEVPPSAMHIIGHEEINNAIHQQLRVDINVQDISKFGSNYFIKTNCQQTTAPMLQHTFLKVGSHTLTLKPWNPYYNAIIFPCETQTTNLRFTNLANSSQRTLTVQISGIPPHLCCDFTVNRLLSEICTIHTISFEPATLSLN